MTPIRPAALLLAIFVLLASPARPADPSPGAPSRLSPEAAIEAFHLADGLKIDLIASEPTVQQPLSLSFDDRGRLWVLEYLQYPTPSGLKPVEVDQYLRTKYDRVPDPPPDGPRGIGKVVILEDPDASGRFRKAREFLSGLDLASGMALGDGGLYVVQPPYLLFYPDEDRDDRPDGVPKVLLKGFGMEDAHAFANSLTWGPDGWLYGAQGSTVTAEIRGVAFQQGIWRYHPPTDRFELFAEGGGNTWGIDFDRHGQLFAGGNTSEPLCHHVQGAYYVKGFGKHGPLHNPFSFGYFDPVRHRGFLGSSLTGGFVIYEGGLFPDRFRHSVIYPNLRVNAMRVSRLEPDRSTFSTLFQEDFLLSSDRWFRPVKSLVGPDGALYVADWYDVNISHTDPKDRSKWYMPSRDTGRIWRVAPEGSTPLPDAQLPLGRLSSDALVDLLAHPNSWYSREARRLLRERRDPVVLPRLETMVRDGKEAGPALEALWALHVGGGLTDDLAMTLLDHPSKHVRAWTIRLLGDAGEMNPRFHDRLVKLAREEPSPVVRSQLACTCKRLAGPVGLPVVEALLGRPEDVDDPHIPLLLWWAIEDKAISDRARVLELVGSGPAWGRPITKSAIVDRLARRYLAEGTDDGYASCARLIPLAPSPEERERLIRAMERQLGGMHLDKPPESLAKALTPLLQEDRPSAALVQLAARLGIEPAFAILEARARDPGLSAEERAGVVGTMGELARPESLAALLKRLGPEEPAQIRSAALLALRRYDAPQIASAILGTYATMPAPMREQARDVLASRAGWASAMIGAVEAGTLPAPDFSLEQVRRVVLLKDPSLTSRAEKLWGQVRPATSREKTGRIMAVTQILGQGTGDPSRGRAIVARQCLNCHQLFDEGEKIGPDLSAVDRKNLDILLRNVIDPAAIIREGYQQYVVATKDGRVVSGLLAENGAGKITVLDAKGVRTPFLEGEVEEVSRSDSSLMPEGLLDELTDQELRDAIAFLRSEPGSTSGRASR